MTSSDICREFERFRAAGVNGDDMASSHLESRFGAGLTRYIRRVLRKGEGTGSLAEFVMKEARVVHQQAGLERDELVREIVRRLCSVITGQGLNGQHETLSISDRQTAVSA